MGNISVGTLRLEVEKGGQSQVREKLELTGWEVWAFGWTRLSPQHGRGLKTSAASTLCFQLPDEGWWPSSPGGPCRSGVGPGAAVELLVGNSTPASCCDGNNTMWMNEMKKMEIKCFKAKKSFSSTLFWSLQLHNYLSFWQMSPPPSKHRIKLLKG